MALPSVGGGYQIGDGNVNEIFLSDQGDVATPTATATLTTAQINTQLMVANPGTSAASYTLPLGTDMDTAFLNAKVNSTVAFTIINIGTSSGAITMVTNTGWGTLASTGSVTIAIGTSAQFVARRTATATWTLYRVC
jgi:hypothetical protein